MKLISATFRDGIFHDGKGTVGGKGYQLQLHEVGVLVTLNGRTLLVPFSNIKWVEVEA